MYLRQQLVKENISITVAILVTKYLAQVRDSNMYIATSIIIITT